MDLYIQLQPSCFYSLFQLLERFVEMDFSSRVTGFDDRKPGAGLAVPGARPAQRVVNRHSCHIGADERRSGTPCTLEQRMLVGVAGRLA
jgi:hypothetical protein